MQVWTLSQALPMVYCYRKVQFPPWHPKWPPKIQNGRHPSIHRKKRIRMIPSTLILTNIYGLCFCWMVLFESNIGRNIANGVLLLKRIISTLKSKMAAKNSRWPPSKYIINYIWALILFNSPFWDKIGTNIVHGILLQKRIIHTLKAKMAAEIQNGRYRSILLTMYWFYFCWMVRLGKYISNRNPQKHKLIWFDFKF